MIDKEKEIAFSLLFWAVLIAGLLLWSSAIMRRRRAWAVWAMEHFEIDRHARIVSLREARHFFHFFEGFGVRRGEIAYRAVIEFEPGERRDCWLYYGPAGLRVRWIDPPDAEDF
jgi:hypothetical protein